MGLRRLSCGSLRPSPRVVEGPSDSAIVPGYFLTVLSTWTSGPRVREVRSPECPARASAVLPRARGQEVQPHTSGPGTGRKGVCVHVQSRVSAACPCAHTRGTPGPSPEETPTLRAMPSSESLLQRALSGLTSSSASRGSPRSVPRGAPSDARRSVPTSRRPSRCSAEPSRGRIWTGAEVTAGP